MLFKSELQYSAWRAAVDKILSIVIIYTCWSHPIRSWIFEFLKNENFAGRSYTWPCSDSRAVVCISFTHAETSFLNEVSKPLDRLYNTKMCAVAREYAKFRTFTYRADVLEATVILKCGHQIRL
jgi:hypothetical protein